MGDFKKFFDESIAFKTKFALNLKPFTMVCHTLPTRKEIAPILDF
jgi:hypothetical protein